MVNGKPTRRLRPRASEAKFWRDAFTAAELPMLLSRGTRNITPQAAAHLAAEYADAALAEYRRRPRDER